MSLVESKAGFTIFTKGGQGAMVLWIECLTLETEVEGLIPGPGKVFYGGTLREWSRFRNYMIIDLNK